MTKERTYAVAGMSCGHCRAAVADRVGALAGVREVRVDLESGSLRVAGEAFTDEAVAAAVAEAGYEVIR